ncbi:MAG TPA: HPr family phosphocarrier protein, partial [Vicinamibacteria bacterium]|nr:HPr family phosphocarrier protein [Vicinamibacteria bacterium]
MPWPPRRRATGKTASIWRATFLPVRIASVARTAMLEKRVQIVNILGLHARAAARFVRAAAQFRSDVTVTKDGTTTDGKSILGVLFLAAAAG